MNGSLNSSYKFCEGYTKYNICASNFEYANTRKQAATRLQAHVTASRYSPEHACIGSLCEVRAAVEGVYW